MKRKIIALTGKIGSGKSAVARILRDMGFKTIDSDELAKQVATQPQVVERVAQLLGSDCVVNGALNRKAIREIVFKDEALLKKYEQIFFDGVKELLVANIDRLQENIATENDRQAVFVEIPILDAFLFTWDEIWRVESIEQDCISRVIARDNVSSDNVRSTLSRQKTYDCDYVIVNNGSMEDLIHSVKNALANSGLI